jgi:hypothetical protein
MRTRSFLRRQILEMERLAAGAESDPLSSFAIQKRKESLEKELAQAGPEPLMPRTVLFFAGPPVVGSRGIDAKFAADALSPFVEMVKTQYSAQKHGRVGARGPRRGEEEARLLLTGLPRGSFGLELSQPHPEDFVAAEQLSEVLVRLRDLIAAAGENDEKYAATLEFISPRVLPRLRDFLGVIAQNDAYLGIESGELKVDLPPDRLKIALERVGATSTEESTLEAAGIFRGATLDSWRFDFRMRDGTVLSGPIAEEVDPSSVEEMIALTMQECVAKLRVTQITTSDGVTRRRYELLDLRLMQRQRRIEP